MVLQAPGRRHTLGTRSAPQTPRLTSQDPHAFPGLDECSQHFQSQDKHQESESPALASAVSRSLSWGVVSWGRWAGSILDCLPSTFVPSCRRLVPPGFYSFIALLFASVSHDLSHPPTTLRAAYRFAVRSRIYVEFFLQS